jgi:integrase
VRVRVDLGRIERATGTGGEHEARLKAAGTRAKLDADGQRLPTFHGLRHAHASAWIAAGGDLVELSARLGHRDPSITAAIYSHEFEAQARSTERRTRLDRIYGADRGSFMAAQAVKGPQQTDVVEPTEPVDLQAIRKDQQ